METEKELDILHKLDSGSEFIAEGMSFETSSIGISERDSTYDLKNAPLNKDGIYDYTLSETVEDSPIYLLFEDHYIPREIPHDDIFLMIDLIKDFIYLPSPEKIKDRFIKLVADLKILILEVGYCIDAYNNRFNRRNLTKAQNHPGLVMQRMIKKDLEMYIMLFPAVVKCKMIPCVVKLVDYSQILLTILQNPVLKNFHKLFTEDLVLFTQYLSNSKGSSSLHLPNEADDDKEAELDQDLIRNYFKEPLSLPKSSPKTPNKYLKLLQSCKQNNSTLFDEFYVFEEFTEEDIKTVFHKLKVFVGEFSFERLQYNLHTVLYNIKYALLRALYGLEISKITCSKDLTEKDRENVSAKIMEIRESLVAFIIDFQHRLSEGKITSLVVIKSKTEEIRSLSIKHGLPFTEDYLCNPVSQYPPLLQQKPMDLSNFNLRIISEVFQLSEKSIPNPGLFTTTMTEESGKRDMEFSHQKRLEKEVNLAAHTPQKAESRWYSAKSSFCDEPKDTDEFKIDISCLKEIKKEDYAMYYTEYFSLPDQASDELTIEFDMSDARCLEFILSHSHNMPILNKLQISGIDSSDVNIQNLQKLVVLEKVSVLELEGQELESIQLITPLIFHFLSNVTTVLSLKNFMIDSQSLKSIFSVGRGLSEIYIKECKCEFTPDFSFDDLKYSIKDIYLWADSSHMEKEGVECLMRGIVQSHLRESLSSITVYSADGTLKNMVRKAVKKCKTKDHFGVKFYSP